VNEETVEDDYERDTPKTTRNYRKQNELGAEVLSKNLLKNLRMKSSKNIHSSPLMDPVYEVKEESGGGFYDMQMQSPRFKLMSDFKEDNFQPKIYTTSGFYDLEDVIAEDRNEDNIAEIEKKDKKVLVKLENFIDKSEAVGNEEIRIDNTDVEPIKEENIEDEEVIHMNKGRFVLTT
jgi:hypothetical protein